MIRELAFRQKRSSRKLLMELDKKRKRIAKTSTSKLTL